MGINAHDESVVPKQWTNADFRNLYSDHRNEVWSVAYAQCLDRDRALACVVETFQEAAERLRAGQDIGDPLVWMVQHVRQLARQPKEQDEEEARDILPFRSQAQLRIQEVLKQCTPHVREIVTMRFSMDYKPEHIADVLGISADSVTRTLVYFRESLDDMFDDGDGRGSRELDVE